MQKGITVTILIIAGVSCLWADVPLDTIPYWSSQSYEVALWGVGLADITNDGYPEVITIYERGYNYLYPNNHGIIDSIPRWQSNDVGYNVWPAFGDYDNDGDLDMAVACYVLPGGRAKIYRNDNGGLTRDPVWIARVGGGTWCDWGDVDNDGDLDLAIVDMMGYPMVFRNNGGFLDSLPCWNGLDYSLDFGGAWVDIDNDGDLDLIVGCANRQEPVIRIYYNINGELEIVASWKSSSIGEYTGRGICACDIDNDGWLDVAVSTGFTSTMENVVFKNLGDTLESYPSWISTDNFASGRGLFGDVDGDGDFDWVVNNGKVNNGKGVVYENAGGNLNPAYTWSSSISGGLGIDLGDVDQDGIRYKEDTVSADGTKKLFYLSVLPIQKITEITINGNSVPISDYCCNLKSGWVSFKNSISAGSQVVFKYYYSVDMELLLSDDTNEQAHLFRNNNIGISEQIKCPAEMGFKVFPNPILAGTPIQFSYTLQQSAFVEAKLYDCSGREVVTLLKQKVNSGFHKEKTLALFPPGIYFLRLKFNNKSIVEKIVIIK